MFKKYLIDLILSGNKTITSRDKQQYRIGDVTNLMANRDYSKITGKYLRITNVHQKSLSDFTDIEAKKEGFVNLQSFKDCWLKNIGQWDTDIFVWIHEFEVIKLSKP